MEEIAKQIDDHLCIRTVVLSSRRSGRVSRSCDNLDFFGAKVSTSGADIENQVLE